MQATNKFLRSFFVVLLILQGSLAVIRTWTGGKHAVHLQNKENCKGLHFPEEFNGIYGFSGSKSYQSIVLPDSGLIALEANSKIFLDPHIDNCNDLEINYSTENKPENWNPLSNRAIPYKERMPCQWDDVLIPASEMTSIESAPMIVKSLKVFGKSYTVDLDVDAEFASSAFLKSFKVNSDNPCTPETCPCQPREELTNCPPQREQDETNCEHPIYLKGFCRGICGVHLAFTGKDLLAKILKLLQSNTMIDYHYGYDSNDKLQMVIVDKDPESGGSYSKKLFETIADLDELWDSDAQYFDMISSGNPIIHQRFFSSALGIVLMTLLLNIALFLVIYVVYNHPDKITMTFRMTPSFPSSLSASTTTTTTLRPFLFARFHNLNEDNEEDGDVVDIGGLAATNVEVGGGGAFDNPLYNKVEHHAQGEHHESESTDDDDNDRSNGEQKKLQPAAFKLQSLECHHDDSSSVGGAGGADDQQSECALPRQEMLKFIVDNLQQVNLLDDQD